ncbi:MAG: DUF1553 domain-containing protein [Planctomycetota bacterium]|nr:DUF1553 domain-containing protein [Planctomycetota bacterium]
MGSMIRRGSTARRAASIAVLAATFAVPPRAGAADELPPAAGRPVDFRRDVEPLLRRSCTRCHAAGKRRGRLQVDRREDLLRGGESGPSVVVGRSADSLLIRLVAGLDPERVMPAKGARLSRQEIGILRAWIDQGLAWPEGFSFADGERVARELRPPAVPPARPGAALTNPIDRLLEPYFRERGVSPGNVVDDRTFARRVHLDVVGVLPPERELEVFLGDERPGKRERLVRRLLARGDAYADHWLTLWNDALRNDYRGTGYIDGGRQQISAWLHEALRTNKPYDEFVRDLVSAAPGAEGFVKGIVWRGVVNASQRAEMQAAQNVAQVFLGTNLKCASCHDSFVNHWKLVDSYGLANVFAEKPLEIHRCDKPTGDFAETRFLYPELGSIDAKAPRKARLAQLAGLLTSPKNGRFARTIVNRLWARFLGRGLVEPTDDMDSEPWNAGLLEWLAYDLVENGHDLQKTIERILLSRAYQLPSVPAERSGDPAFVFRGPLVRRLSAEQFVDAACRLTGVWQEFSPAFLAPLESAARSGGPPGAHGSGHGFVKFSSDVVRSGAVDIDVELNDARTLWLVVTDGGDGRDHDWADWLEPRLEGDGKTMRLTETRWKSASTGHGKVRIGKNAVGHPILWKGDEVKNSIGTHAFSVIVYDLPRGYRRFRALAAVDSEAVEKSPAAGHSVRFVVMTDVEVRASWRVTDPLTRALGRPNREQVVTERDSTATTLQALELTNGGTLDILLRKGAKRWLDEGMSSEELVPALFRRAFGRAPTAGERETALEVVGVPPSQEGVHDLLWIVSLLPEFQLIY